MKFTALILSAIVASANSVADEDFDNSLRTGNGIRKLGSKSKSGSGGFELGSTEDIVVVTEKLTLPRNNGRIQKTLYDQDGLMVWLECNGRNNPNNPNMNDIDGIVKYKFTSDQDGVVLFQTGDNSEPKFEELDKNGMNSERILMEKTETDIVSNQDGFGAVATTSGCYIGVPGEAFIIALEDDNNGNLFDKPGCFFGGMLVIKGCGKHGSNKSHSGKATRKSYSYYEYDGH
eukprot:CAMPEP_0178657208 /NCGR_PEP_ID=MMETSP0698-20121128/25250_1 /TAXON_ID=265572 /ORGANISM="Extubocellulus spinifer, Strain CCMP396" /LENGTH=231 /DNA_ID=CAMNT_0020299345 /DNA_START=22 /DNA_END=717 /DNA_ORIENTATION=+